MLYFPQEMVQSYPMITDRSVFLTYCSRFVLILYYHTPYLFLLCSWGRGGGLGGSSVLYITTRNYLRKTLDLAKGVGTRKPVNLTVRSSPWLSEVFVP